MTNNVQLNAESNCITIKMTRNSCPNTSANMGDFITTLIFKQNGGDNVRANSIKHHSYLIEPR